MFYRDIQPFTDFSEVSLRRHYHPLPDDWYLVIADIQGSTEAINRGCYKDVNMIGAACITAVLNVRGQHQLPYVFGGDGATLAIPTDLLAVCSEALKSVQYMAMSRFSLNLRVGMVPVKEIHRQGLEPLVAKFRLSPNNYLATFSGGGVELAEHWVKRGERYLLTPEGHRGSADLNGLSCRWEPLKSRKGIILNMLVQAHPEADQASVYSQVINQTAELVATDTEENTHPVASEQLKLRWPPVRLSSEIQATRGEHKVWFWSARLYLHSLVHYLLDRFNISFAGYRPRRYRQELQSNSDFRRFDDTLRILFDCTSQQANEIESFLEELKQQKQLSFGLHRTDRALMTCLVFDLAGGEHIHFLDGDDGGFAMAAKAMKAG